MSVRQVRNLIKAAPAALEHSVVEKPLAVHRAAKKVFTLYKEAKQQGLSFTEQAIMRERLLHAGTRLSALMEADVVSSSQLKAIDIKLFTSVASALEMSPNGLRAESSQRAWRDIAKYRV